MAEEAWGYCFEDPNYEVSSFGRVRRKPGKGSPNGRILKLHDDGRGYYNVTIGIGTVKVHHLIARAFIGKKPFPEAVVNHKDSNPHNNHYKNLEWCTEAYNMEVALVKKGQEHYAAKLTEEQVKFIKESDLTVTELANKFLVSKARISQIRSNKGWNHLNQEPNL